MQIISDVCGHPIFLAMVGLSVGAGIMIIFLAKWGRKLFSNSRNGSVEVNPITKVCFQHNVIEERLSNLSQGQTRVLQKLDRIEDILLTSSRS